MPETTKEMYRSFTVRVPISRYIEMSDLAKAEGKHLNQKVQELLTLGLGKAIKLDEAVARLLKQTVVGGEE